LLSTLLHARHGSNLAVEVRSRPQHIPGLDGLRAVSIMIVLVGHFLLERSSYSTIGVYIFFVISGFLITTLMYAERDRFGTLDVKRFYLRRLLRLYPVLIAFLAVVYCVALSTGRAYPLAEASSVLFYCANYLMSWQEMTGRETQLPIAVLWSLSVEEHFYLLMPAFFLLTQGRKMVGFAIALCIAPIVIRIFYLSIWPWIGYTTVLYQNSELRMDSIAYGVLLAALYHGKKSLGLLQALGSTVAVCLGAVLLVASFEMPQSFYKFVARDTLRTVALVPLVCNVLFSAQLPWLKHFLNLKLVAWVGVLSYSLYVWHGAQQYFFTALGLADGSLWSGWCKLVGTFCCAIASYYLVEKPFLRFKTHFNPASTRTDVELMELASARRSA
jgi:peptidoglycan/LPS O-acetylase OafA/YrhL